MVKKNKDKKKETPKKQEKIHHPLTSRSFLFLFYGLLFPGLGHFLQNKKTRAWIFAVCVLVFFILGLTMNGKLYKFHEGMNWLHILGTFASMAAGVPYFIALIIGWGIGDPTSILEPYGNYFLLAAGMLNILIALDAMDIAAGRKE